MYIKRDKMRIKRIVLDLHNLVPRSLVDEAEGETWPNPICITSSPARNVTGEAIAHAQHKFGEKGRFCGIQQAYDRPTT